jgi:hypothetical protein
MPLLKEGSKGPDVVSLQTKLKALGFDPGNIDGKFGSKTEAAVIACQKKKGLLADGMVGPKTLRSMQTFGLDLPFHLFQVLEEEYVSLYGELEEPTVVSLNLDWSFHPGHIKNWEAFKLHLQNPDVNLPPNLKKLLDEQKVPDWRTEQDALDSLNRLLGKYFYNRNDYRSLLFSKTTEKLLELYPKEGEVHSISSQELKRLNRFVLEELFAEHLENVRVRSVDSYLDWNFHSGHIKDWEKFKRHLQSTDVNLPSNLKKLLDEQKVSDWRTEQDALDSLNRLLGKYFYNRDDFRNLLFSKTTEKLLELYPKEGKLHSIATEELKRLNRFLLEELFAEHLENVREIRLAAIYQRRHDQNSAALCLSGGGIRSGTFALGLLQGLARHDLLKQFDYLSTVSGGGYIGSWLSAWIHRHPQPNRGVEGVTKDLTNATPRTKIDPDPAAIRHLREYSNFLTPKAGLMSTDTWTFVAIYVRNLLLNWSVIIPLILAFLLLPRFNVGVITANPKDSFITNLGVFLPKGVVESLSSIGFLNFINLRHVFLAIGFLVLSWAIAYMGFSRPGFRSRLIGRNPRWKDQMGQGAFLWQCLIPLVSAAFLLTTYLAWTRDEKKLWHFLLFGTGTALLGWIGSAIVLREGGFWGALLLVLAGAAGGLFAWSVSGPLTGTNQSWAIELYAAFAVPLFLMMFMLATTVFAGITSHSLSINDEDREWWARFNAWTLISALAWAAFSLLVIFGPLLLLASPRLLTGIGGLSGIVALLLGRSSKTPATSEEVAQSSWLTKLSSQLLPILAIVFVAVFVAALSLATSKLTRPASDAFRSTVDLVNSGLRRAGGSIPQLTGVDITELDAPYTGRGNKWFKINPEEKRIPAFVQHMRAVHLPRWWFFLLWIGLLMIIGFGLARLINLNLFSLHNGYRNRLIRGFLAASRDTERRRPNPFTGFDPADNVYMHELRPALLHEVDFKDVEGFVNQLKMGGETLAKMKTNQSQGKQPPLTASEFLYTQLSDTGKAVADGYTQSALLSPRERIGLIEDLNRILEGEQVQLWRESGFVVPPVPAGAQEPQAGGPSTARRLQYHIHRNRQALDHTFPQFIEKSDYPPHRLLHVVNTTLNLVGGDNLAWQQRKAESFTVSPLHSGSYRVGYRRSKDYGGDDGISLGTAMTISGAAASSNMGYYTTSPVLSLVLTLFNVRLGWWLGNPGPAGSGSYRGLETADLPGETSKKIYRRMSPTLSVTPVFYEAFGLTDDRNKYVYLTDGGHFENLALYEMVLRRCRLIVVSDGAADPKYEFNDLANAVRKVRIDLGIHIEFPDVPIYRRAPDKENHGGCYWAIGKIRYSDIDRRADGEKVEDGVLVYIKPAVYEDEPEDVIHYKRTHPTFPHETTADQFFDEPQFESYRALGSYIMTKMCGSHSGPLDLQQFESRVRKNFLDCAPQVKKQYDLLWPERPRATDPVAPTPQGASEDSSEF